MSTLAEPEGEPEGCYKALAWATEASKKTKQGIAVETVRIRINKNNGYDEGICVPFGLSLSIP